MAAPNQRLGGDGSIALGDTVAIILDVSVDGAAYAPTVVAAVMLFKRSLLDADAAAIATKTLGNGVAVSGTTVTGTLDPADQASLTASTLLYWGCRIKEASGRETEIASGTVQLTRQAVRNAL